MKTALVVSGMDALSLQVIRSLGDKGMKSIVAGSCSGRLSRLSRHCAAHARLAASSAELAAPGEALLDGLAALAAKHDCGLVVPVDVPGALCAAALRSRLPGTPFFPFPAPDVLRRLDDKWTFHELMKEQGLPFPRTWLLKERADAYALRPPLVLKPRADGFSRGVRVVRDAASRDAALDGFDPYLRFPVLAQDYVDGQDVDLSFLADRGRLVAWTVQTRDPDGSLRFLDDGRVVALGRALASATGYTGLAHVDMRYDGHERKSVLIIEFNPRFWGSFAYSQGLVDFIGPALDMAAGGTPPEARPGPAGACPGLLGVLRRAASGRFDVPAGSRAYLGQKLSDPLPMLFKAALHVLGAAGDGA